MSQTTQAPPDRSLSQRRDALEVANRIRSYRAALKRDLKAGRITVRALLDRVPDDLRSMKILDLLLAVPKIGRTKALKVLAHARISPAKTVGGLTARQREELLAELGGRAA